jgi:uncharacterized protein YkwD
VKDDHARLRSKSFSVPSTASSSDIDGQPLVRADSQRLFHLTNETRIERRLKGLKLDSSLSRVADSYCRRMAVERFFDHEDPSGGTLASRLSMEAIEYSAAGENLAIAPSPFEAHAGLVASSGHLANILGDFSRMGVAAVQVTAASVYFVEVFTR